MRTLIGTLAGLTITAATLIAPSARGAGVPIIVSGPGSTYVGYTTPAVAVQKGDTVTLIHLDTAPHDVVAVEYGPDTAPYCGTDVSPQPGIQRRFPLGACPIFWTPLLTVSQTAAVEGLGNLVPGTTYNFFCSLHGNMKGTLVALPV